MGRVQADMTSGDIPLPSLPTTQITEPEKLISVIFFAPSDGVEAKVSIPFLAAKIKREGKFPVVKTEIRIEEPIAARSAFGLYISHPPPTMTPLMPNASAVLSTAPEIRRILHIVERYICPLGVDRLQLRLFSLDADAKNTLRLAGIGESSGELMRYLERLLRFFSNGEI